MCNCINELNELLKDTNTRLDYGLNLMNPNLPAAMLKIATFKHNTRRREKAKTIYASYCPICGVKYENGGAA